MVVAYTFWAGGASGATASSFERLARQPAIWRKVAVLVLAFALGNIAHAVTLTASPQSQTVERGTVASVDVILTELAGHRIGAYDFFVNFNDDLLDLLSIDVGPSLGAPYDSLSFTTASTGRVDVVEVSLFANLSGLQSGNGSLRLFTMRFATQAIGVSPITFSENILGVAAGYIGDEAGAPIALYRADTAEIVIVAATPPSPPQEPPVLSVPEPGSFALTGAALIALCVRRQFERHRSNR